MRLVALLAIALAACGGSAAPAKPKQVLGPEIDERTAESDAKGTLKEIYGAISRAKPDNLFSVVDEDVIVFGPRTQDAHVNRTDALVALGEVVDPRADKHAQLRAGPLAVVPAKGGRSAGAFDVVDVDGSPMAVTAILSSEDEFFRLPVAAVARTPSMKDLRSELKKTAVVPTGAKDGGKVASEARGAVERFQKGLIDQEAWGSDLGSRSDAIVIGPTSGEVTRGKKDIKKLWKKRVEAETRAAVSGEIRADVTADGQLAWVTAPITRVEKDEEPLPLRAFAVFEKDGASWRMIALHEALALDEPGAGSAFVKILPPAPRPAEPEPAVEKAEDKKVETAKKKKKKKKAKKKKKKKKSDDDDDDE